MTEKQLVENFKEKFEEVNSLDEKLKKAKKQLDAIKFKLLDMFDAAGTERTASYEDVGFVTRMKPRLLASCREENKPALFEFLKEEGRCDMIKQTVHPSSLSSFVGELIENGHEVPEIIPYILKSQVRLYPSKD